MMRYREVKCRSAILGVVYGLQQG